MPTKFLFGTDRLDELHSNDFKHTKENLDVFRFDFTEEAIIQISSLDRRKNKNGKQYEVKM